MASDGDNSAGTSRQLEGAVMVTVTEGAAVTPGKTDNAVRPTDISMLHDYAMDYLFGFLPLADLKNCRLVNRSWNLVSNRAIQKRDYVIQFPKIRVGPPVKIYGIEQILELVQVIRNSVHFPWTKYSVDAQIISTSKAKHQLCNLLRVVSPFVTEIGIWELHNLPNLEYPNLRKLNLGYDPNEEQIRSNRKSHLNLVERASKLTDIGLTGPLDTQLFKDLLELPNCRNITRLSLAWWIKGEHLVRLSEMGLQLKYLYLVFELPAVTVESLRAFLQSQRTCLEHLELLFDEFDEPEVDPRWRLGLEFPCMEKLKDLKISRVGLCSRISFKDMFPELKRLTFCGSEAYPMDSFLNDDIEPVETVDYLRFEDWPQHPEWILQAARQFPKLRSISLVVNRNLLNLLGHAMPQLEEMDLSFDGDDNMDAALTGFLVEEMESLRGLPINQLDVLERNKEPLHFLKNLKRLRLSSGLPRARAEEQSLTDFGCRFALLKMGNLQVLELKGNFSQVSDPVMERMQEKFVVRLEN